MSGHEQWHLTADAAERYEQFVARYILGPWAPLLVDAARLVSGERVLDVACGTGIVARIAAQRVGLAGHVLGIDLNPAMIRVAQSLSVPIGAQISYLERDVLDLQLPDSSFDVVLCQQGIQFFPDKAGALGQMRCVLDRRGRIALSVWNNVGLYNNAVSEALAEFLGNDAAIRFNASRQVPTKGELRRLAMDVGFAAVDVRVARLDVHLPRLDKFVLDHLAATPLAPTIAATDPQTCESIGARAMQKLHPYVDGDGITYPEEIHVLTAHVS